MVVSGNYTTSNHRRPAIQTCRLPVPRARHGDCADRATESVRGPKWSGSEVRARIASGGELVGRVRGVELVEDAIEVLTGELPLERLGDLLVAAAEVE